MTLLVDAAGRRLLLIVPDMERLVEWHKDDEGEGKAYLE
jgi:hypothetical protein